MPDHTPIYRPALHSRPRRHRRLPTLVAAPLWAVTAGLAIVAILRVVAWDDYEPFAVLNALTAFVYLPVWIVLVVAAVGRRFVLAGAALLIGVAQIAFLLPELTAAEPVPTWATHAPAITLLDANVYNENPSMAGYAKQIAQFHPQLVTMEEATPSDVSQLHQAGALAHLPYQFEIPGYNPSAFLIASRYPLAETSVITVDHRPLIIETTLMLPSGRQPLWVVHTTAPLPPAFGQWHAQLTTIAQLVRKRGPSDLLIVGDFNATWGNRGFRSILDTGMTDAAAARSQAFAMTWSQIKPVIPPVVRIDHVLTGSGVAVTRIRTDVGPGSDHRDLMATVAIRR